ncbi:MAG: S1C family serine protease [Anaerolineaceae bacterium]
MNRFVKSSVYLLLIIPLAACQLSFLGSQINPELKPTQSPSTQLQPTPVLSMAPVMINLSQSEDILVNLYERVNPGVVAIQILNNDGGALGSGFVYDEEGHIVTNYHVVEGATDLEVDFPSGFKARGNVIGKDLDSDLAVVKVEASPEELFPLPLGNSDQIRVGQTVVAIGNPFGLLGTMTMGIVSAKGRTMESMRESAEGNYFTAGDMIQTDAAINPGNSGGPLLNLNGEVIGLNRAIRTTGISDTGDPVNSGIGYAISSNIISRVIPTIIEKGSYDYPFLGVTSREDMSLLIRETLGLTRSSGAYVIAVSPGGPADEAGIIGGTTETDIPGLLAGGDLIVAIDGRPVHVFSDLLSYMVANKSPGDSVTLNIVRHDQEKEVQVVLDKRP